jgi:undecaprenyl-diphosphatase
MLGASLLKLVKFIAEGVQIQGLEIAVLLVGCVVAFGVSLAAIRVLMDYVRKNSFSLFGVYRILLGVMVLLYFITR